MANMRGWQRVDVMEVIGPMFLFIGVVCVAAVVYFVVTFIKGRVRSRREEAALREYRDSESHSQKPRRRS